MVGTSPLMQYAPGTAIDVSEVISRMANLDGEGGRWDDFDLSLEAFNDIVEEQKQALKVNMVLFKVDART